MFKITLIIFLLINTVFSFVFAESEILWFDDAEQGDGLSEAAIRRCVVERNSRESRSLE